MAERKPVVLVGGQLKELPDGDTLPPGAVAGGGGGVSLSGETTIYVAQSKTYAITNYNVFSSYVVQVSAGSVGISGDQISFTAPVSAQTVTLTVIMDGAPTNFSLVVQGAGVTTPTNSSPSKK